MKSSIHSRCVVYRTPSQLRCKSHVVLTNASMTTESWQNNHYIGSVRTSTPRPPPATTHVVPIKLQAVAPVCLRLLACRIKSSLEGLVVWNMAEGW